MKQVKQYFNTREGALKKPTTLLQGKGAPTIALDGIFRAWITHEGYVLVDNCRVMTTEAFKMRQIQQQKFQRRLRIFMDFKLGRCPLPRLPTGIVKGIIRTGGRYRGVSFRF